jgi:type IV pilus assembly protein PilW
MPYPTKPQKMASGSPMCGAEPSHHQRGVTLIELMVGITIGLLTVTVALSALMVSRSVSGTVTDSTQMQQQAAYAFRVIGQQVRQAGSIKLNLAFSKNAGQSIDAADLVAFETDFARATNTILGKDTPGANEYQLKLGYQNYAEPTFPSAASTSLFKDCLGDHPSATIIQSGFILVKAAGAATGELKCAGSNNTVQPIISKVADFQVRYLVQGGTGTGAPTIQYSTATEVEAVGIGNQWPTVFGVEVCLELVGDETINTTGTTYRDCGWKSGDAEKDRGNRLRMVFRNTYQLRSQGSA